MERNKYQIVDTETGEFKGPADFPEIMNGEGYRFPSHKLGPRMFSEVEFPREMTDGDIAKMTRLAKRCLAGNSMLGYRKRRGVEPYTTVEIAEIAGCKPRQGRRFVSKMLRLRVMQCVTIDSEIRYYVNPAYYMPSGKRLTFDIFSIFREELTPLIPDWAVKEFDRQFNEKLMLTTEAQEEAELITRGER